MNPFQAAQHAVLVGLAGALVLGFLGALLTVYFGE